jgi:hypothetical protein
MAGYNSIIHDPIDDLICDIENKKRILSLDQLNRLLFVIQEIMDIANNDPDNKNGFFKTQLECNQAKCNIVQIIRVKALMLELHGVDSTGYVLSCFNKETKNEVFKKLKKVI